MLVKTEFRMRTPSEADISRALAVFAEWKPPSGFDIQTFCHYANGNGGFSIAAVEDAESAMRALAAFVPWVDFTIEPIVSVETGTTIHNEAVAFRDGVS